MHIQVDKEVIDQRGARVIPSVSVEVSMLVGLFKDKQPPLEFSYNQLQDLLGCRQNMLYRYLYSARRILLRDHAVWIDTVRGSGVRMATDSGKVKAAARDMSKARAPLISAAKKLDAVDTKRLTDGEKKEHLARQSVLNMVKLFTKPSLVEKVMHESPAGLMPSAKLLEMFKNKV